MRICDALFLLLTRDDGKIEASAQRAMGLRAAAVMDLVVAGRVQLDHEKDPRLHVVDPTPTGDPVLDPLLGRIAHKGTPKFSAAVADGKVDLDELVGGDLHRRGLVGYEPKGMLGMRPARYPALDPVPEQQIRSRLAAVLSGVQPTPADVTVLAILQGLGVAHKILERESGGRSQKDLKRTVEGLSVGDEAGQAVKRSVDAMNAALMAAVVIPMMTTTVISSN